MASGIRMVQFTSEMGQVTCLQVDGSLPLRSLAEILQIEFQIAPAEQRYSLNGRALDANQRVDVLGITPNDL
eukprot:CAMPEP_0119120386 /NCGR_PEP_ID=MMETSP1310-20130426/1446_1 /TAXON_ID=464262 /ORGANISM="Genus nov. species nov., Strain RCC2339" /LENGTH=71 /DNA_ID=CAMNT_0007109857 /DNA_START=132 /DNA_END=343 /DNA_ORIENTATION=+